MRFEIGDPLGAARKRHVHDQPASIALGNQPLSWSSEFICPIWVGRLADPTTRKGCKESLD